MKHSGFRIRHSGKILLVLIACFLPQAAAHAANHCYAPEELKAEQLLRLHSELMVITVTCKQGSTGRDLVRPYVGFTKRHTKAIQEAEATLINYYAKAFGGDGIPKLDKLRTKLANEFGQTIADESAPAFCARARDKVLKMYDDLSPTILEDNIRLYRSSLSYVPQCAHNEIQTASADTEIGDESPRKKEKRAEKATNKENR
ncbi:MAG: hypothetical protein WC612_04310 [Bdellovibrionales bacterium]|jgi:hypothetical protein